MFEVEVGAVDVTIYVYFMDDDGGTAPGEPTTGLLFSNIETGGSASTMRQGAARADFTLVTVAVAAAHIDGGFIEVDATNMPGVYRLDLPDVFATGADFVIADLVAAAANNSIMRPIVVKIRDNPSVNVAQWLGTAPPAPNTAGVPLTDLVRVVGGLVPAPAATGVPDVNMTHHVDVLASITNGELDVNIGQIVGTVPSLTGGDLDVNVAAMAVAVLTAAAIAANALEAGKINAGALNGKGDWNIGKAGYTANPSAGGIIAASFGAGALDAAAFNADTITKIRSLVDGTADAGGSTTVLRDAARTEIDDTWNGCWLLITSGTDQFRPRLILDFANAAGDITFAPAVSAAIGAGVTYEILPNAAVDIQSWLGLEGGLVAPNALVGGAMDSDVSALQANVITAAAIAAAALDNKGNWNIGKTGYALTQVFPANFADLVIAAATGELNANVVEWLAGTPNALVSGRVDGSIGTMAANVLTAAAINANAFAAAKFAADYLTAINGEVVDGLTVDTIAELAQGVPPLNPTLVEAIMYSYMMLRNRFDVDNTGAVIKVYNSAGVVIAKKDVTDDGTLFSEAKTVTGP